MLTESEKSNLVEIQLPNIIETDFIGDTIDKIYKIILSTASQVHFPDYIDKIGGDHKRYIIDGKDKIPLHVVAVITNIYTMELIDKVGFSIAQLYSNDAEIKVAYLFNGKYWIQITEGFIKMLLRDVLMVMGYDPIESKTARLSDLLIRTFWTNATKSPTVNQKRILVNLQNTTLEIMPNSKIAQNMHNKNDFIMYCLPYNFNPIATHPIFTAYINRVLPDMESQMVLQELLGSIFIKNINPVIRRSQY